MPEASAYGVWPRSGEIDIVEARGNDMDYPGGRNIFFSTLHWGKQCTVLFLSHRRAKIIQVQVPKQTRTGRQRRYK